MLVNCWKAKEKRPQGKIRLKLEDNIKMVLRGIRWGCIYCMHLAHVEASGGFL
jgi:hypothetical protein